MHCSRVDAFRHRAASIIADRDPASHVYPSLTLPLPSLRGALATKQSSLRPALDCFVAEFIIGPARGRTRWLLAMTGSAAALKTRAAPQTSSATDYDRCSDARAMR
jgi:hypothetical protein